MTIRTWEDELRSRGKPVTPGPNYKCPECGERRHAFAIVRDDGDESWRCTTCRAPESIVDTGLTWNDVRGVRRVFLLGTDWTQLPDVPEDTRQAWAPLRQRARDVGEEATPEDAMEVLRSLQDQAAAM